MQAWRVYNRSALDFNLFFCSRTAEAMERALPDDERAVLPLIWRAGVDDWDAYLFSHFRHIQWHHFKQAACAPLLKDDSFHSSKLEEGLIGCSEISVTPPAV